MRPQDLGIGRFFESVRDAVIVAEGHIIDKAHNEFLQAAATTGLLGLAAYLWVLVLVLPARLS